MPSENAQALLDGAAADDRTIHDAAHRLAAICESLQAGPDIVAAAYLYPALRAGLVSPAGVTAECGDTVTGLLTTLARLDRLEHAASGEDARSSENLRKLLLVLAEDVRAVLLGLVLQLDALRHADRIDRDHRVQLAKSTRDIWAPLASRLGVWQLKWELEDLAFRVLDPDEYRRIADWLNASRSEREQLISAAIDRMHKALADAGVHETGISGRPKHLYSIWRKMRRKLAGIEQVLDVQALRVVVDDEPACYAALGVVHGLWQHIPGEFDDYIAHPKQNGYRSLHTAVIGPGGRALEVQIRTREMHEAAELGVASHWRYKSGMPFDATYEQRLAWLRQLLEPGEAGDGDLLDRLRNELFDDRVYALTPQGRIIDLPSGATVLDFAYYVHTDLGHACRGAKVNGQIAPLGTQVHNGDRIEILSGRHAAPSRDWLIPQHGYLASSRARDKVRAWFRRQDHDRNAASGRQMLERELNRLNLHDVDLDALGMELKRQRTDDLYAAIGAGDTSMAQVSNALQRMHDTSAPREDAPRTRHQDPHAGRGGQVRVEGVGGLVTHFGRCCSPLPNDPIAGYVTRGHGVTIHRADCHNLLRLRENGSDRILQVSWGEHAYESGFPVEVDIVAWDRKSLLQDITAVLAGEKVSLIKVALDTNPRRNTAQARLTLEIAGIGQLSRVLNRIALLPNVISAKRL